MDEWLSRTRLLFGDEPIKRLQNAHVLVVGVGGVGAYAAEMIVRAGIGALTIIDGDTVSESNLNRQLVALHSTLGKSKVEVLKERFLDINPDLKLTAQHRFIEEEDIPALLEGGEIDFVIDEEQELLRTLIFFPDFTRIPEPVVDFDVFFSAVEVAFTDCR